jgi:hypothetical protein
VIAAVFSTFIVVITVYFSVDTSSLAIARVNSTSIIIITFNRSKVYASFRITVEFNAVVSIRIFNRSVDTSDFSIARVISASIVIIADNRGRDTTRFKIARIGVTFIVIVATIRIISNKTSFFFIAVSFMTFIRRLALRRDININASRLSTAAIFSASIIIVTFNFYIFTRACFLTVRIT